jgi:hypothetical protein
MGTGTIGTNGVQVRINTDRTLSLMRATTVVASSSPLAVDTWHLVQFRLKIGSGATDEGELIVNGASVGSFTAGNAGFDGPVNLYIGRLTSGGTFTPYYDDLAVNDDQGADENSWPDPAGVIAFLKPTADDQRVGGWRNGGGGVTNLWDGVDNIPPVGSNSPTAASQIFEQENDVGANNYDARVETYASKLTGTIKLVQPLAFHGFGSSGGVNQGLSGVSNPASAEVTNTSPTTAVGAFPANWGLIKGTTVYGDVADRATGAVVRVKKLTFTGTLSYVCQMGLQVEYVPGTGYNDVVAGAFALVGTITESYSTGVVYTDAAAGSLALAGTCVDTFGHGFMDAPAGSILLAGTCVDEYKTGITYSDAPSGRMALTGTCIDQKLRVYSDAPTATLALAGMATSTHRRVYSDAPTDALVLTGSATSEHVPPTPYASAVLGTAGLISYWRLGESQGTAEDFKDGNNLDPHNVARVTGLLADDPNGAMEVSGAAGSYLDTINNLNPGQRLTWEFWCRPTAVPARSASVISKIPPLLSGTWLIAHEADGRWNAMVRDINSVATTIGPVGPAAATGKLQHVVMTYDSVAGQMKLFINGVSVGSQSRTPNAAVQSAGGPSYFGGTPNFVNGFVGVIDELAYYNVALTPAQIQAHYELGGGAAVDTPQGQIPLGGSCVDALRRQSTSAGTLKLAGSRVERWGHVDKPQGNVSLTGSVVEEWLPPKIYGTLPLSGAVQESFSHSSTPVGSLKLAGTAVAKRRYADEASGDIAVSGAAEDNREISDVCAGVLRLAGVLSENLSVSVEVDGTIRLSGRNSEFITIDDKIFYDDFVIGLLRLRGFVVVVSEDITPGRGGRVVEGIKTGRIVRQLDTGRVVGNLTGRVTS